MRNRVESTAPTTEYGRIGNRVENDGEGARNRVESTTPTIECKRIGRRKRGGRGNEKKRGGRKSGEGSLECDHGLALSDWEFQPTLACSHLRTGARAGVEVRPILWTRMDCSASRLSSSKVTHSLHTPPDRVHISVEGPCRSFGP